MKKLIAFCLTLVMMLGLFTGCVIEEDNAGVNKFNLTTVKEGYLTVVTSPDYAPYEFYAIVDGEPQLAGFDMDLAKYIADYLGLTLDVIPMSFDGIVGEMGAGVADLALAGLSPDPERAEKMDFSMIYYGGKQAFVTNAANKSKFTDLASTNNAEYSIGAQTGTIQMELAEANSPDADIVSLKSATDIIAEVAAGTLDGAYIEWDVAQSYKNTYSNLEILCEVPYEEDGNIIGVNKGNADLLKYVNEAIEKCVNDGTFAQFLEKANTLAAGEKYEGTLDEDGNIPTDTGNGDSDDEQ